MKRFAYLIFVSLFTTMLIQGFTISSSAVINTEAQTVSEEIKAEDELIKVNIRYPIIRGGVNKKINIKLNEKFKNDALNFKNDIEKQAREGFEASKNQGFPFRAYEAYEDFKVTYNKNNILSIPVTFYYYTGGAHGGSFIQPNNIDLLTGNFLTLKDVFKEGADYRNLLIEKIISEIKRNPENYFPDALQTVQKLTDSQPFYLTEDGIVIYYGEYDIAAYAYGIREFKIPFSVLGNVIKVRFVK